jgi:hypothetical protein
MPLYRYFCRECDREEDAFQSVDERHNGPHCHGPMQILICAPNVMGDLPGYESPTTGRWIEGRAARREDLKRSNARPYEGFEQEKKEAQRRRQEAEAKADAKLDKVIRETYATLPPAKRRALETP